MLVAAYCRRFGLLIIHLKISVGLGRIWECGVETYMYYKFGFLR
jgi:hypothetical protein